MKKKWTILLIVFAIIVVITIGCKQRESTKEEVYNEFQKKIVAMKSYTCIANIEVKGNKSSHEYVYRHSYTRPNYYKLEVISPKHLKGKTIEYKDDKILIKNQEIKDNIELPNVGENDQYLFIGDFIENYLQNEEVDIKLERDNLVIQTPIPGEDEYFNQQVLYVDIETKNPKKMEILDDEGNSRFIVNYEEFEYKK